MFTYNKLDTSMDVDYLLSYNERERHKINNLYPYSRYDNIITANPFKLKTVSEPKTYIDNYSDDEYKDDSLHYERIPIFCPISESLVIRANAPVLKDDTYGYVHATPYEYNDITYYAAQCPRQDDMILFLTMLFQANIHIICITTDLIDKNKTLDWIPNEKITTKNYHNYHIDYLDSIIIKTSELSSESITIYDLNLWTQLGDEKINHNLKVFKYNNWIDKSEPKDFDTYIKYVDVIRDFIKNDTTKSNILIHCSAGIGRTGILLTSLLMYDKLFEIKSKELVREYTFNLINEFRKTRFLVQLNGQFEFVIKYLENLFDKINK